VARSLHYFGGDPSVLVDRTQDRPFSGTAAWEWSDYARRLVDMVNASNEHRRQLFLLDLILSEKEGAAL
jgi:hypothetical protein